MEATLELKELIANSLSDKDYSIYKDEADKNATYPYVVFELSKSSAESYPFVGILEINVWDRHHTYSRADAIMDIVEKKIRNQFYSNDYASFRAFDGERDAIVDEDKSIKRIREKFMIRYSLKGE